MGGFTDNWTNVYWPETRQLVTLALPICGAQLAQAGMGVADTIMTGRFNATSLAAVSVGSSLWTPLMLFMTGTLLGLTPIVAHLLGGQRNADIPRAVHQALWVALALGIVMATLLWSAVAPIFTLMDVPAEVASESASYLGAVAFGMPGIAIFLGLRAFSDGMNHTRPALWVSLVGLGVNIPANYVLIYGGDGLVSLLGPSLTGVLSLDGLPALGAQGSGIATAFSMWSMALAMIYYTSRGRSYRNIALWQTLTPPDWHGIRELLIVGIPIGVAIFVEVTLFTLIALFIASFGEITVGAHQIALSYTSILFMLPMSLSMALTVRVGNTLGQQHHVLARQVAWNGIVISIIIAAMNSLILWVTAVPVIALYTDNENIQALALSIISLAVIFQLSDSLQVNLAGALRGYKDTRVVMVITVLSYWVVGLGGGHWLGTHGAGQFSPLGVHGYWIGLIAGLTTAALLLGLRLKRVSHRIMK